MNLPRDRRDSVWRWWHLPLLASCAAMVLFARPQLTMLSRPGIDPLAVVVLDSGLNWRVMMFVIMPLALFLGGDPCAGLGLP